MYRVVVLYMIQHHQLVPRTGHYHISMATHILNKMTINDRENSI
jgi:hypothetical protein